MDYHIIIYVVTLWFTMSFTLLVYPPHLSHFGVLYVVGIDDGHEEK